MSQNRTQVIFLLQEMLDTEQTFLRRPLIKTGQNNSLTHARVLLTGYDLTLTSALSEQDNAQKKKITAWQEYIQDKEQKKTFLQVANILTGLTKYASFLEKELPPLIQAFEVDSADTLPQPEKFFLKYLTQLNQTTSTLFNEFYYMGQFAALYQANIITTLKAYAETSDDASEFVSQLSNCLITIIQRAPRLELFFKDLKNNLPQSDTLNQLILALSNINKAINCMVRREELKNSAAITKQPIRTPAKKEKKNIFIHFFQTPEQFTNNNDLKNFETQLENLSSPTNLIKKLTRANKARETIETYQPLLAELGLEKSPTPSWRQQLSLFARNHSALATSLTVGTALAITGATIGCFSGGIIGTSLTLIGGIPLAVSAAILLGTIGFIAGLLIGAVIGAVERNASNKRFE